jgi:hypothetical protein
VIANIELITDDQGTRAKIQCRSCGDVHLIPVDREAFDAWRAGKWAQDAFKEMKPAVRELFVSGTCGKCFDEMFKFPEDEEEEG